MSKHIRTTMSVSLFGLVALCTSQVALAVTMYGISTIPAVDSTAIGVNDKRNVLTTTVSLKKSQVASAWCNDGKPTCKPLAVKYGGGMHPARYVFMQSDVVRKIAAVGQVYVKNEWYATFKYGLGLSRFNNDKIITPGIAYGVANNFVVGETTGEQAFSYNRSPELLTILPTLGGILGSARAVNAHKVIVGHSTNAQGFRHATMWINGIPQDMGILPDGQSSTARAINDAGVAVGCADKGLELRRMAVKFEGGAVVELGALNSENGNEACATIITADGTVAGWSDVLPGEGTHPFIMEGETMVDLNDRISEGDRLVYELMLVGGISPNGQLAVTARRRADSATVVLLLTPVP